MRLLVTGGAGYVGSVVAAQLLEAGHEVVVLDDLSTGHAGAVPPGAVFVRGTIRDEAAGVLAGGIDAVLHFAARSLVGESVAQPGRYWSDNLGGTLALLDAMRGAAVRSIVFSSTAAVYGEPERIPVQETDPPRPTSPYGASKLAVDVTLQEYARLYGQAGMSLRYFNVAGAYRAADGRWLAERHSPETHLIPTVLRIAQAADGGTAEFKIYGDDYPTPDGTCVRDYIHVADLARAHLLALGACVGRPAPGVQPRQRHRILQPRGAGHVPRGDRRGDSGRYGTAPGRGPGHAGRLLRPDPPGPRLEGGTGPAVDRRRCLGSGPRGDRVGRARREVLAVRDARC